MKKLLVSLLFCFGIACCSFAQTANQYAAQFATAVVNKDATTMSEMMHPRRIHEVSTFLGLSDMLNLQFYEWLLAVNSGEATSTYVMAMSTSDYISEQALSAENQKTYITPSRHCFLCFDVKYENGRYYIYANEALTPIARMVSFMMRYDQQFPTKYYQRKN